MSLLAAGMLLTTGYGVATAAVQTSVPAKEAKSEEETPQKPYGPDIQLSLQISEEECYVEGELVAPTELMGDWYTGTSDKPIDGSMTIRLVKSLTYSDDKPILIEEWENVEPGQKLQFTDKDVTIGQSWQYRGIAVYNEQESEEWYGKLGIYVGLRPLRVTDLTLTADKATPPITVSLTVPNGFMDEDNYPNFTYTPTRVYVTRGFCPVDEWEQQDVHMIWEKANPEVDTPITFQDTNEGKPMEEGTYYYEVFVEWQWGESYAESASIGLYQDSPGSPQNVEATPVNNGMLITWDPVVEAYGNGYLDPESVLYDVYRYYGYEDTEMIGENIKETEFFDDLEGIDEQMMIAYQIFAKNDKGQSSQWDGQSESVIVGPACPLPFVETFGKKGQYSTEPDMLWINRSLNGGYISWVVDSYATYYLPDWSPIHIKPTDSSKGVAYAGFADWQPTGECDYISGDIDFKGHDEGMVTVRYYGHPDALADLSIDVIRHDEESDEYISETIWSHTINADEEGWIGTTASFAGYTGCDKVSINLRATCDEEPSNGIYIPVVVEYISLQATDGPGSGIEMNETYVVSTQYFSLQGVRLSNPEKGMPVIRRATLSNGKVITSKVVLK